MTLNKNQIKYLRKMSHTQKSLFQMGKNGLTPTFMGQIDSALERRELVKFNLLQNSDESLEEAAHAIASELDAVVVQTIGSTAILFRPSSQVKYQILSQKVKAL